MFSIRDSIKFMMVKIFFTLADFSFKSIYDVSAPIFHGANTLEINYIKKGKGKLIINDTVFEIEDKSFFVIPSFTSYSIIPDEKIDMYSTYFLIDDKIAFKEYLYLIKEIQIGKDNYNLDFLFDDILSEFRIKRFGYNEIVVSNFKNIIVKILRNQNISEKRISHWDIENLQYDIEEVLYKEYNTITIIELANRFHMSVRQIQRYLKDNYNKTFQTLKNEIRMNFAVNKLIYTNISVADLALLVGYSTPEHFIYSFKKYYHTTPYQFRKENSNLK